MALTDDDVREILRIVDESDLDELSIETAGFSLHVSKAAATGRAPTPGAERPHAVPEPASGTAERPHAVPELASGTAVAEPDARAALDDGRLTIPSPMLGTFYRAESPGAAPFVDVGARVGPDTTVCIIEVMKMMNSVPAGVAGQVAEIVAENGQLVEFGEPLFRIAPQP
jgi:acetyl-CoA carboxylase biotin carboxyl carrier protein